VARARARDSADRTLLDDLRLARDAVGIRFCTEDRLAAAVSRVEPELPPGADVLEAAKAWLTEHVTAVLDEAASMEGDPKDLVVFASLRGLLLGDASSARQKASVIRREVLRARPEITFSADALRKREDRWLPLIAEWIMDRLGKEPFSVRSMFLMMEPELDRLIDTLMRGVDTLDGVSPMPTSDAEFAQYAHAVLQSCGLALMLRESIMTTEYPSELEIWVAYTAYTAVAAPAVPIAEIMDMIQRTQVIRGLSEERFAEIFLGDSDRVALWRQYLQSCHGHCAFARSDSLQTYCRPHQLIGILMLWRKAVRALRRGRFDEWIKEMYGDLIIPDAL
jgi:hypothetical protein